MEKNSNGAESTSCAIIEGSYSPAEVERNKPAFWEDGKFFIADARKGLNSLHKFVMVIPPPNVTGSLHLGHTMMAAIEDTLTRWHRMSGKVVLWLPGTDHAGIATQSVVERSLLREEGISRHELGREKFIEKVMEWKNKYGSRILYQLRRLGCSCDWSREAFTMSPAMSKAVTHTFVTLYDRGLIYRDERLVSWCPHLQTALSEIEVEPYEVEKPERIRVPGFEKTVEVGCLWHFKYQLKNRPDRYIEVATTRLETMLGDVAVAVNPKDQRYADIVEEELIHPFIPERHIIIIADEHCDPEFGTGAVKITPAHDKNDYDIAKRHGLPSITIFTLDGKISTEGGTRFAGLHRFEARLQIEKALTELELMGDKVPNTKKMAIPRCSRSNDVIEYMLLPQWYVNCDNMAKRASDCVRRGELTILPDGSEKQWFYWMDSIRDWCISRQLWWGHQIPAYLVVNPETKKPYQTFDSQRSQRQVDLWVVGHDEAEAEQRARDIIGNDAPFILERDPDVLDTWFSSGLFPFSTLGWPDTSNIDFKSFFPTQLLETGWDILFFWVARMVMLSLELLDVLPFKTVFLHPMVRDAHGKKMSKSLGNVVDPVDVIEGISLETMSKAILSSNLKEAEIKRALDAQKKDFPNGIEECGADALRYGLLAYLRGSRGINLDINRVVGYKHFCNKLWNASKFAMSYFLAAKEYGFSPNWAKVAGSDLTWSDRWILHCSSICAARANEALSQYDFERVVSCTYSHWLFEICDIYLELLKPRLLRLLDFQKDISTNSAKSMDPSLTPNENSALQTLFVIMERGFRLLHPMVPFVSEELWQKFVTISRDTKSPTYYTPSICIAEYPLPIQAWTSYNLDDEMELFMSIVKQFRSMLAQFEVPPKIKLDAFVKSDDGIIQNFLRCRLTELATLAKLKSLSLCEELPPKSVTDVVSEKVQVGMDPAGTIDFNRVVAKLEKKSSLLQKQKDSILKRMSAADYETKVPEDIRSRNAEALASCEVELQSVQDSLKSAQQMISSL